jgi:hypothetical protein
VVRILSVFNGTTPKRMADSTERQRAKLRRLCITGSAAPGTMKAKFVVGEFSWSTTSRLWT